MSALCCLPNPLYIDTSTASPFAHLVVSSPLGSPRAFFRGRWVPLEGPCCTSLATVPRSVVKEEECSQLPGMASEKGSILAAVEGKGSTIHIWDLPSSASTSAISDPPMASFQSPRRSSLSVAAAMPQAVLAASTTRTGNVGNSARQLTSLCAWGARRCFVTADS